MHNAQNNQIDQLSEKYANAWIQASRVRTDDQTNKDKVHDENKNMHLKNT